MNTILTIALAMLLIAVLAAIFGCGVAAIVEEVREYRDAKKYERRNVAKAWAVDMQARVDNIVREVKVTPLMDRSQGIFANYKWTMICSYCEKTLLCRQVMGENGFWQHSICRDCDHKINHKHNH